MPTKRSKTNTEQKNKKIQKWKNKNSKSGASTNPDRRLPKKQLNNPSSQMRDKGTIKLLNLYRQKPDIEKMHEQKVGPQRIEPDRKWFGNIRTIDQKELDKYKSELAVYQSNPYSYILKNKKIDLGIFTKTTNYQKNKLTDVEKFEDTFGPNMKRMRPKVTENSIEELAQRAMEQEQKYDVKKDSNLFQKKLEIQNQKKFNEDKRITAGQSKRIWDELYKVIDSSDVLCMVLDARDPMGTKCVHAETHLKKNCRFKHIVYILNKIDLVPTSVTAKWVKYLSQFHPTITFRAGVNGNFGRESLIRLLRQFDNFHKDKKTVSVGFVGYPNVGKSSIINSLRKKKVCKAAPIPGETKVWQYVSLTNRIYLIDCPGVVYKDENDTEVDIVLKGVVRPEKIMDPDYYIEYMLERCKKEDVKKVYGIDDWDSVDDFLKKVAVKFGRLLKQNEPDIQNISIKLLNDWQRGNLPHYTLPPETKEKESGEEKEGEEKEAREEGEGSGKEERGEEEGSEEREKIN